MVLVAWQTRLFFANRRLEARGKNDGAHEELELPFVHIDRALTNISTTTTTTTTMNQQQQQQQWTTPTNAPMALSTPTAPSSIIHNNHNHNTTVSSSSHHRAAAAATSDNHPHSCHHHHHHHSMELRQVQRASQIDDEMEHVQTCHMSQEELLNDKLHSLRQRIRDIEQDNWKYDIVR